jgi:phosphatidylinositol alpha-1,6-mannosyltransferase
VVLTNSEFTADGLRRELPELSDRIRVVPLCIDPERIELWESASPPASEPRRELAALIVGRMWSEERGKGHDALIEAWPSVRRALPDARLWIAGEGDDSARLVAKARDHGVADCVHFLGRVPNDELGSLYRRASVFAMPSCQEGFGWSTPRRCGGLPCIGTTADAAGQVIAAGETGELVPYGDVPALSRALVGLLSDPDRAARMGAAARRRARERFSYARFREDLLTALQLD